MAQGRGNAAVVGLCLVAVFGLLQVSSAKNVVVGGPDQKWDYPPGTNVKYYDTWSAEQTLAPGDTLEFQYTPVAHDVQIVSKADYDACSMASNGKKYVTGNDVIPLAKAGDYYFICSVLGHCSSGMKVSVTVAGAAAEPATPPPTPPVTPPATPPVTPPASPPPVVIPPPALSPVAPAPVPVLPAPVPAPAPVLPAPVPAPVVVVPVPPAFAPASVPVAGPGSSPPPMTPGVDGPAIGPAPGSSGNTLRVGLGMVGTAAVAAAVAGALLL